MKDRSLTVPAFENWIDANQLAGRKIFLEKGSSTLWGSVSALSQSYDGMIESCISIYSLWKRGILMQNHLSHCLFSGIRQIVPSSRRCRGETNILPGFCDHLQPDFLSMGQWSQSAESFASTHHKHQSGMYSTSKAIFCPPTHKTAIRWRWQPVMMAFKSFKRHLMP